MSRQSVKTRSCREEVRIACHSQLSGILPSSMPHVKWLVEILLAASVKSAQAYHSRLQDPYAKVAN